MPRVQFLHLTFIHLGLGKTKKKERKMKDGRQTGVVTFATPKYSFLTRKKIHYRAC